jgi:hypothetical protein
MKATNHWTAFALVVLLTGKVLCQETPASVPASPPATTRNPWAFNLTIDGYIIPDDTDYASPDFTADRTWLHLEARYNSENLRTGSFWVGRNFSVGKKLELDVTPMIGAVFGRTTGIAPGCEASLTYKKLQASISNEYVFDTRQKSGNFYYTWPQLTYSPLNWLQVGLVAQRTRAFQTSLDIQRGFFVGVSHKQWESNVYVFNTGFAGPSFVLALGRSF